MFNNKIYKSKLKTFMCFLLFATISSNAQFQYLYKRKELTHTGIMGMGMFYSSIDADGFPIGFRGDIRARLLHLFTAKFAYYRSNSMKSGQGELSAATNMQVETCFLFRKLKMEGVSFGVYAGYDQGIRNTKFNDVTLIENETGKNIGNSSSLDPNTIETSNIKILFRTQIPHARLGFTFYNYSKKRYEQYYLCYNFITTPSNKLYTTDVSYYNLSVPLRYNVGGLTNSKQGVIFGYNALVRNIAVIDFEIGFRPSFYQVNPKEKLTTLEKDFFLQLGVGIRIF